MSDIRELYRKYTDFPLVVTDTRIIRPNSIYFALKGEHFDGNRFAAEALRKGAAFAVIDDPNCAVEGRTILVDDVLIALQSLAHHHRMQMPAKVIGITGSNGKTTTKELVHAVLSRRFKVLATQGNFNNHIGVPLTLLQLNRQHELAIVEMGANHVGEIALLSGIAAPDFGIITNIGKAHLKGFGSFEGVVKAKSELYNNIRSSGGTVFVNSDDDMLMQLSAGINRITYGKGPADNSAAVVALPKGRIGIRFADPEKREYKSQLFGAYNFYNILLAIVIGRYFNIEEHEIVNALENYVPLNNRSQIVETGKNVLVMDAYNANPSSMEEALRSFAVMPGDKRMVILGDMFELGDAAADEHARLIELLTELAIRNVILVGPEFSKVAGRFMSFPDTISCCEYIREHPPEGQLILLKGSRGMHLESVREFVP